MQHIRDWRLSDAEDLARAIGNKSIQDNLRDGIPFPYSPRDAEEFIGGVLAAPAGSLYAWAIQHEGRAVGSIGLTRQGNVHRLTAELGYYLAEPYWGRGIVTAAIVEACKYAFENTDIVRIFAEPFSHNQASQRVLEKAGFAHEGTMRKNVIKNGEILDMELYALVR